MDTQSDGTFSESEQPGSAVAEGRYPKYRHAVSGLSQPLTSSHNSQRYPESSDLSGTSSRREDRSRSPLPDRVNTRLRHSNGAPPATEVSANLTKRASREAKETPDSYFLEIASDIRDFDQRWTTLNDAPTPELHKLTVQVSALVKEYSVNPDKRTENEAKYLSLGQLGQDETGRRSVMLELIPSLKTEVAGSQYVDFNGLVDTLTGRRGHVSHLYTGRLGPVQQVDHAEPTQEITAPELPEPDPHPSRGPWYKVLSFPGF
jgi:hypothetical protein